MLKEIYIDQVDLSPLRSPDTHPPAVGAEEVAIARETMVVLPILVRHNRATGRYELIQGERQFHLAKLAQIDRVPADIQSLTDVQAQSLIQADVARNADSAGVVASMDPMAQAREIDAYRKRHLSYQVIGQKLGLHRSEVAHRHSLLRLQPDIQKLVSDGRLKARHGRLLAQLTGRQQIRLAHEAVANGWSVRELEAVIAGRPSASRRKTGYPRRPMGERKRDVDALFGQSNTDPDIAQFERQLVEQIGQPVRVVTSHDYPGGLLVIRYFSNDELAQLTMKLAGNSDDDLL